MLFSVYYPFDWIIFCNWEIVIALISRVQTEKNNHIDSFHSFFGFALLCVCVCRICPCVQVLVFFILFIRLSFIRGRIVCDFFSSTFQLFKPVLLLLWLLLQLLRLPDSHYFYIEKKRKIKRTHKIILRAFVNRPRAVNIIVYLTQRLKSQKCTPLYSVCVCAYKSVQNFAQLAFSLFFCPRLSFMWIRVFFFSLLNSPVLATFCSMLYSIHIQFLFYWKWVALTNLSNIVTFIFVVNNREIFLKKITICFFVDEM